MEARFIRFDDEFLLTAGATVSAREVWQLPSGEAAYLESESALSSGSQTDDFKTRGKIMVDKSTSVVFLPGQEVWWDHSANLATYQPVNDRDFCLGICADEGSVAASALKVTVDFNKRTRYVVDNDRDGHESVFVGTQGLNTMGVFRRGGAHKMILSATSEAQKMDMLGVDFRAVGAKMIVEGMFRIVSGGAAGEPDFNIGIANGTNATDADSITQHVFLHIDGNSTTINAQSKDGTTTVAATSTSTTYSAGSAVANRVFFQMDCRDLTSVKIYINGARVLSGTTFRLDNASGPLTTLAHLEKTASTTVFEANIDFLRMYTSQQ